MPSMNYAITATDGLTPTPSLIFKAGSDLSPEVNTTVAQVIKTQIPNLSGLLDYPGFHFGPSNSYMARFNVYYSNGWHEINQLTEWTNNPISNYLSFFIPFSNWKKIYVCTESSHEDQIPSKSDGGLYFKVNNFPTKAQWNSYTRVQRPGFSEWIPILFPLHAFTTDGEEKLYAVALDNYAGNEFLTPTLGMPVSSLQEVINPNGVKISLEIKILSPGETPPTTEERITTLEHQISAVQNSLSSIETQMSNLLERVNKILSATSTFFVSR